MEVLKQTSPQAEARAPKPSPRKIEPSSRARIAFMNAQFPKQARRDKEESKGKRKGGNAAKLYRKIGTFTARTKRDSVLCEPVRPSPTLLQFRQFRAQNC